MTRQQFLRLPAAAAAVPQAAPKQPNVVVLMSDQHRPEYMGGHDLVPTPNIDRIAARGVRFPHAYCPYPVCAASRMALLSGLYPHTTGVIANTDRLDWRTRTIAHHFSDAGYTTGLIGKMHFNDAHSRGFQYHLGFNDWFMYLGPKVQHYADEIANHPIGPHFFDSVHDDGSGLPELPGLWGKQRPWSGKVSRMQWGEGSRLDEPDQFDAFVARESLKFIRESKNRPFFLIAGFLRPHPPLHPPRAYAERYPAGKMSLPEIGELGRYPRHIQQRAKRMQSLGEERLKAHRAGYLGNLAYVDTCIGEVYNGLEEMGLLDNTIVVYTSDHGEMDGEHGIYQKFCLFEPSVGVPLIVSWPKRLPRGKVSQALVEYIGLYPTLAELAGTPPPRAIEARSFARQVRQPEARGADAAFSEYNLRSKQDCYMVRTARHKFIWNRDDTAELYDMDADPGEYTNLAGKLRRIEREMEERLRAWFPPEKNRWT